MPAPEGNDHAVGNPGGGAPKGNNNAVGHSGGNPAPANQNAAKHHLTSDPAKVLAWLEKKKPEAYAWVEEKTEGYLEDAPFDADSAKADQLRQVVVREYAIWKASGIQLEEGIVKQTHQRGADGDLHEVESEHPVNKPLDRMERTVTRRLKELGILDDPDSQTAQAIGERSSGSYEIIDVEAKEVEDSDDGDEVEES